MTIKLLPDARPRGASPGDQETPNSAPLSEYEVPAIGNVTWKVSIYPTVLRLEPSSDQPTRTLDHRAFVEKTTLNVTSSGAQLTLDASAPKAMLFLKPPVCTALRAWLTPALEEHLAKKLIIHRVGGVVWGLFWVVYAVRPPAMVRPTALALGVGWLALAAATVIIRRRELFLIDAVLMAGAGIYLGLLVNAGDIRWWWLIVEIYLGWLIKGRLQTYRFYGPVEGER